jgi:uncharacterized cupredoxin-like copper-binding protein
MGVLRTLAAGAAFLVLAPGEPPATRTVVLTAHHSGFSPAKVELVVGGAATQRRHEHGRDAHHHGDVPGEVSVPAGATASTTYRFDRPGRVLLGCHLPGHWDYGMRGSVTVLSPRR